MNLELKQRHDGVTLRLRVVPGSRCNAILGERNGALRVAVTQVAEKGKANKALVDILAQELRLRKSDIAIVVGTTSKQKQVFFAGVSVSELSDRIERVLQSRSK